MDRDLQAACRRIFASATAWSWCECTPPGETRPMRWQSPPEARSAATKAARLAGASEPSAMAAVDPRQVLHHHTAGADVHVADLGIAHLPGGQAYIERRAW